MLEVGKSENLVASFTRGYEYLLSLFPYQVQLSPFFLPVVQNLLFLLYLYLFPGRREAGEKLQRLYLLLERFQEFS